MSFEKCFIRNSLFKLQTTEPKLPAPFESILLVLLLLVGDAGAEEDKCGVFGGEIGSTHSESAGRWVGPKEILLVRSARVLTAVTVAPYTFKDSGRGKWWNKAPEIDSVEAKWSCTPNLGEVSQLIGWQWMRFGLLPNHRAFMKLSLVCGTVDSIKLYEVTLKIGTEFHCD